MKRHKFAVFHEYRSRNYHCRVAANVPVDFEEVFGAIEHANSGVEQLYLPHVEEAASTGRRIASSVNSPQRENESATAAATSDTVPVPSGAVAAISAEIKTAQFAMAGGEKLRRLAASLEKMQRASAGEKGIRRITAQREKIQRWPEISRMSDKIASLSRGSGLGIGLPFSEGLGMSARIARLFQGSIN